METNQAEPTWQPKVLDLSQIEGAFFLQEGFSRPSWKLIRQAIKEAVPPESVAEAWHEAAMQWVLQVQTDLGGKYQVRQSREFILLSELDADGATQLLRFAEATRTSIYDVLKDAAWQRGIGKHVVLLFTDQDDYYQYVSFFYKEGVHPTTGGVLLPRDYVHIAMPYGTGRAVRPTLVHELAHNSVVHLRLPTWLNEGLAVLFERMMGGPHGQTLDSELRDRHLGFWNRENIQKFWAGVSFREPGDSNELSYSLAEIMVQLLLSHPESFRAFLKEARWGDAGQTAALDCLGMDLGQVMGTFLGEGDWRPYRKALVGYWRTTSPEGCGTS